MNNGLLKEKSLVEGLFKEKEFFKKLEYKLLEILSKNGKELNYDKIIVKHLNNQDNIKDNHTWDCTISDGKNTVGISIKSNYSKTTKHPQHKSLIRHIFSNKTTREKWLDKFLLVEKEAKTFLLNLNPKAKTLLDVRKDVNHKTIKSVDISLGRIYQTFFYEMLNSGLTDEEVFNFLQFSLSSKEYIKVVWNKKDKFVVEDYLNLEKLLKLDLNEVSFNKSNSNIELSFSEGLVLSLRFKISSYKKSLIGSAVKCEINIKNKPEFIKKYSIK